MYGFLDTIPWTYKTVSTTHWQMCTDKYSAYTHMWIHTSTCTSLTIAIIALRALSPQTRQSRGGSISHWWGAGRSVPIQQSPISANTVGWWWCLRAQRTLQQGHTYVHRISACKDKAHSQTKLVRYASMQFNWSRTKEHWYFQHLRVWDKPL